MMKKGTRVRMSEDYKRQLRGRCGVAGKHLGPMCEGDCWGCSSAHVEEFGDCVGIVEDLLQPNCPEVNVRWLPSKLRYAYDPINLVKVD